MVNRDRLITDLEIQCLRLVAEGWASRLKSKGRGLFVSNHEILGVVAEEYQELIEAVTSNDVHKVEHELMDIVIACLHGIATIINDQRKETRE